MKEEAVLIACHVSLSFIKREGSWEICLHHLLSNSFVSIFNIFEMRFILFFDLFYICIYFQTQKIFNSCTSNIVQSRRKQLIQIIRHSDFPCSRIDEVHIYFLCIVF